jgi:cytochrome P450
MVRLLLGAANHDPEEFADPDRLVLERASNPHLSFGFGIHYCLGAHLARLELEIALATLFEQLPGLAPEAGTVEWSEDFFPRGVRALPVRF